MKLVPITVVETQAFARAAAKLWNEVERAGLVDFVAHNPEAGDVIPGTGGVRKLRWSRVGSGKRGGARVVYFYYRPDCPLYLLLAYAKAQGKGAAARVHTIEVPDVRAIRKGLGLSQQAFASAYRIPLPTLKGWEQGRRQPDATASAYLAVIASLPNEARDVLRAA